MGLEDRTTLSTELGRYSELALLNLCVLSSSSKLQLFKILVHFGQTNQLLLSKFNFTYAAYTVMRFLHLICVDE
jgi:hypothetical protein